MNLEKATKEDLDREILRAGIIAELDAINLYEQMAVVIGNEQEATLFSRIRFALLFVPPSDLRCSRRSSITPHSDGNLSYHKIITSDSFAP